MTDGFSPDETTQPSPIPDDVSLTDDAPLEPAADKQSAEKRTVPWWAWLALAILLIIVLWLLWQFLAHSGTGSKKTVIIKTTTVSVTPSGMPSSEASESSAAALVETRAVVPDVIGMLRPDAIAAIENAGYVASVTDVFGVTKPANTVFQQNPSGGSALEPGGTVGLLVQKRPGTQTRVTVPNVVGLQQSTAESRLRAMGLTPVLSYGPAGKVYKAGIVRSQLPKGGTRVDLGSDVQIQINVKP